VPTVSVSVRRITALLIAVLDLLAILLTVAAAA
jgi:hypothetical protein